MNSNSDAPYDNPRTRELLQAANDSARLFRSVFVSFTLATLYFLVVAVSANDEMLFMDGDLRAPILNVGVRTSYYFAATPWILLLLHFNILIQAVFLARKIEDYKKALPSGQGRSQKDEMTRLPFPIPLAQLASDGSSTAPRWLLKLFVFVTVAFLPLATLGIIQTQFLDFQHFGITTMHSMVIVLDLVLIWHLWPKVRKLYEQEETPRYRLSLVSTASLVIILFFIGPLFPSFFGSTEENEGWLTAVGNWLSPLHSLDVQNRRLYLGAEEISPFDACKDKTLALNLTGRSYRNANLSRSILCNAVLTDIQLQGANLIGVQLQGANMTNARLQGAVLRDARLQEADLTNARLQEADLTNARLQEADLTNAQFQGAVLREAWLQGARLRDSAEMSTVIPRISYERALIVVRQLRFINPEQSAVQSQETDRLRTELQEIVSEVPRRITRLSEADSLGAWFQGADLSRAQLQEAILPGAQLQGAYLDGAQFQGANLQGAGLQGAHLRWGQLQGADLRWAQLQGADLRSSEFQEADLSFAQLQGADVGEARFMGADLIGTQFQAADLRRARLQGAEMAAAQLQGTRTFPGVFDNKPFMERIEDGKDRMSDLAATISSGRLFQYEIEDAVGKMNGYVPVDRIEEFEREMEQHINRASSSVEQEIEERGGVIGSYGQEEAEQWIDEYMHDLCEAFAFDPNFLIRNNLAPRVGISENTIRTWDQEGCGSSS